MNFQKIAFVILITGCSKSNITPLENDHIRPPLSVKGDVSKISNILKNDDLTPNGIAKLFRCDEKFANGKKSFLTEQERLVGFKYSTTNTTLERNQVSQYAPFITRQYSSTYSTKNHGLNYELSVVTEKLDVGNESALTGPLGYKQSCKDGKPCEEEEKVFFIGSKWDATKAISSFEKLKNLDSIKYAADCGPSTFDPDAPDYKTTTYKKIFFSFLKSNKTVPAIEIIEQTKTDISCNLTGIGNLTSQNIGQGIVTKKRIVAIENLVNSPLLEPVASNCDRTLLFRGTQTELDGKIIKGDSWEHLGHLFDGDLKAEPVEN